MKRLIILLALLAAPATAQVNNGWDQDKIEPGDTILSMNWINAPHEIFRMSPGACLRGPLVFKKEDGTDIFRLDAGVEYPTGCGATK